MLHGVHVGSVTYCYGDWRVNKEKFKLELSQLSPLLTEDKLRRIQLDEIAWKGKHLPMKFTGENCICCGGKRYKNADIRYPGIVVEGMPNMYGDKYRLIDGKHRIRKLYGRFEEDALFYVLYIDEIEGLIQWTSQ